MSKLNSAAQGVADAWDFYLSQHDVSVPDMIERAVEKAWTEWLEAHSDDIIAAIAEKAAGCIPEEEAPMTTAAAVPATGEEEHRP
jgi:hypothetical protein